MGRLPIITIDGPAGAGKSTISKILAARLSFEVLDTGAIYRALAYRLKREGWDGRIDPSTGLPPFPEVSLRRNPSSGVRVIAAGEDVTEKIRTEEIGLLASKISALPEVREWLLPVQRQFGAAGGIVAEGRDMGTVVFPDAEIKFFLDASPEERARRRQEEMAARGEKADLSEISADLDRRDRQDRERAIAPLAVPPDAAVVDSSNRSIMQVVDFMISVVQSSCPG